MKTLCVRALLLFPIVCVAAGYGGAEGRNQLGELVYIAADSYYDLYVIKGNDKADWSKPWDMNKECPEFNTARRTDAVNRTFSCPPQRKFPLSGATYRITTTNKYRPCNLAPFYDKTPGTVYLCIKGCTGKNAPRIFKEGPWECS